jgi:DNA polymerase (family 10)
VREDRGELGLAATPALVETADIRAELHAHTTASDGVMTLDELVKRAEARGFHTIAVTDHSRSSVQANGLSIERLRAQRSEVESARERFAGRIALLHGSEVDILSDGSLDYDDEILSWLDIVVASPHAALSQEPAKATARLLKAIAHPLVHIVGHPTGRIIGRRKGLEPAMNEIIAAAVEHDVALEINTHWLRLDLRDTHVRAAVEAGCKIAIDSDVHAPEDFDNLRYGVATGRRGWLPPDLVVNTWPADRLHAWLRAKR